MDSSAGVNGEAGEAHMCDMCGKTFTEPACLALHYRQIHAEERPFECEVCGKSFTLKRSLVVHRQIHAGERSFKCEMCGKSFSVSFQLELHMRKHTGEKPYVCSVCNKGFACKNRLKVHSRIHTGEKPFACDLCNQMFAYKYLVKRHHQMVHLGERQFFKCPVCTADFTYKRTLNAHIKMHQLSQPASSQQASVAAVTSSSTNSSITSNPCDIGDGMANCITVEYRYLNSSTPQQSQGIGQLSFKYDLLLPHNNLQKSQRYTIEKTHRQQLLSSMLFGCAATVNSNRAKGLLSNNNFQESQEEKQQQISLITYINYSKVHHHDSDSIDFRHIPPLIPIDSNSHLFDSYEK